MQNPKFHLKKKSIFLIASRLPACFSTRSWACALNCGGMRMALNRPSVPQIMTTGRMIHRRLRRIETGWGASPGNRRWYASGFVLADKGICCIAFAQFLFNPNAPDATAEVDPNCPVFFKVVPHKLTPATMKAASSWYA